MITLATPAVDVADELIERSLQRMLDNVPMALEHSSQDEEYVHQLRVGSSRVGVALKIFRPFLGRKEQKRLAEAVRGWRQAAGQARDLDVFAKSLRKWRSKAPEVDWPAADYLLGFTAGGREAAQLLLQETAETVDVHALETLWHRTRSSLKQGKTSVLFGEVAGPAVLTRLSVLEAGLANPEPTPESLHQTRIDAKNLRYALELAEECFAPEGFKPLIEAVEEIQEVLGIIHDCDVAQPRLAEMGDQLRTGNPEDWQRWSPGFAALDRRYGHRREKQLRRYRNCQAAWQEHDISTRIRDLFA